MARALPACLQPRLGLEVMGSVPPGCFGFRMDDNHSALVLTAGELAEIDATARELEHGALFLIEWNAGDRDIVETYQRPSGASDGPQAFFWWTGRYNRPRSREELAEWVRQCREIGSGDGPYARTEYLVEKLIGRVVGVLAPDRHSRDELMRLRDVRSCASHILATGYGRQPAG